MPSAAQLLSLGQWWMTGCSQLFYSSLSLFHAFATSERTQRHPADNLWMSESDVFELTTPYRHAVKITPSEAGRKLRIRQTILHFGEFWATGGFVVMERHLSVVWHALLHRSVPAHSYFSAGRQSGSNSLLTMLGLPGSTCIKELISTKGVTPFGAFSQFTQDKPGTNIPRKYVPG